MSPDPFSRRVVALAFAAWVGGSGAARGASVVVTVVDRLGAPVDGAAVVVSPASESGQSGGGTSARARRAVSDLSGIARVESVLPGRYVVDVASVAGHPDMVSPSLNPRAPTPVVVVGAPADVVTARVELWRGTPVRVSLAANRRAPLVRVWLRPTESVGPRLVTLGEARLEASVVLSPGRWAVVPEIPSGWLLTEVVVDGQATAGADAVILAQEGGERITVDVAVEGMGRAWGGLDIIGPSPCPVRGVSLQLLEPGPWIDAARRRGGSTFETVPAAINHRACEWSAIVPSGRWRVTVDCGEGCRVEPASPVLDIAPGDDRALHFRGEVAPGSGTVPGASRSVLVEGPDGTPVAGAIVEAWRTGGDWDGDRPSRVRTDSHGRARVAAERRETLRVVAGHPDHLDAETLASPDDTSPVSAREPLRVALRASAAVEVVATDADERALPGVVAALRAVTEPDDRLRLPEMRRHRRERAGLTDADGRLAWRGLHGGEVLLSARVSGADAERFLVELQEVDARGAAREDADADAATLRLTLVEGASTRVAVRVRPAGRIGVSIDPLCDDLPREIDLVVVPAERLRDAGDDAEQLLRQPTLRLDRLPRVGPGGLDVTAGPLTEGSWLVALRPDGFARWTLAPGVEVPEDAEPLEVVEGAVARVESLDIDCAPLAVIAVRVLSGGPSPDLTESAVDATWAPADPARGAPVALAIRRQRTRVRLERVPQGSGRIRATLSHPHLLPEPEITLEKDVTLDRAAQVRLEAESPSLGGAIAGPSAAPFLGARRPDGGFRRIVSVTSGVAVLPSLEPGEWVVADCADAACAEVQRERMAVVEAGKTARLP